MELAVITKFQSLLGVGYKTDGTNYVKYKSIYYWFMLWTLFGAEYGYLVVLPIWHWNVDSHVLRHALVVTVAAMYVGQWIKSYTPWPRPSSPPVVRLEHIYVAESTMPSTHACLGTALPFSLLFFTMQLYDISTWTGIFIASFSAINICLSRIYLGMHYPSDIIAGSAISALLLVLLQPYVPMMDALFLEHTYLAALGAVILAIMFPAPSSNENGLRADTCRLLGVLLAAYIGTKFFFSLGLLQLPCVNSHERIQVAPDYLSFSKISICVLRFAIGLPVALLCRAVSRIILHSTLMAIINNFPPSCRPPKGISLKRWGPYEIPFYLISYTLIALTIILFTTYGFYLLGLTSPDYLTNYPAIMKVPHDNPLNFYCVPTNLTAWDTL